MEQVAADLPMELIFSKVKVPRGRGKVERFFRTVNELLLQDLPGYAPEGSTGVEAKLTLPASEPTQGWLPLGPEGAWVAGREESLMGRSLWPSICIKTQITLWLRFAPCLVSLAQRSFATSMSEIP